MEDAESFVRNVIWVAFSQKKTIFSFSVTKTRKYLNKTGRNGNFWEKLHCSVPFVDDNELYLAV